ncbi:MAG TPA: hypothetical protein VGQ19_20995, partial [Burkholderiales bacterium]|nr:hypothetical protein [Burkholderiales bacterium]
ATESARIAEAIGSDQDRARAYEVVALACLPLGDWHRGLEFEQRRMQLSVPRHDIPDVGDIHV